MQQRIRLGRMAYLTFTVYRRKLLDGGLPCDGGRGICRNPSTDTPRH